MLKLVWRPSARQDLRTILNYISERNPVAANDLLARINECAERLPDHPFMYRSGRRDGTREAVVHPNYMIVYQVAAEAVEIVNIMHTRRQYPPADTE